MGIDICEGSTYVFGLSKVNMFTYVFGLSKVQVQVQVVLALMHVNMFTSQRESLRRYSEYE